VYYEGSKELFSYPSFQNRKVNIGMDYLQKISTIDTLTPESTIPLLKKMGLKGMVKDSKAITVEVPPYRPDILHACDIAEDVMIAYGINNIGMESP